MAPSDTVLRFVRWILFAIAMSLLLAAPAYAGSGGAFRRTRPMWEGRANAAAALLHGGRVLVAGGISCSAASGCLLASAEVFDPATSTWTTVGSMLAPRLGHTATTLADGRVLVVGGAAGGPDAELFDPMTETWTMTGPMQYARQNHTATLLGDGTVFVAGGSTSRIAEVYDPTSNTWTTVTGKMREALRYGSAATLLNDGSVLITGGVVVSKNMRESRTRYVEIYTPGPGYPWALGPETPTTLAYHTATRLQDGRVLVTGGDGAVTDGNVLAGGIPNAILYDPSSKKKWVSTAPMSAGRIDHTATLLADGTVLVAGGSTSAGVDVYDPALRTWLPTAPMSAVRLGHTATPLDDGRVLIAGGIGEASSLATAEIYEARLWTLVSPMTIPRHGHAATSLGGGKVLVTGGRELDAGYADNGAEVYDATTNAWTAVASMSYGRLYHTATRRRDGSVLVAAGEGIVTEPMSIWEVFDPAPDGGGGWTKNLLSPMNAHRQAHTATLLDSGEVLVAGGDEKGTAETFEGGIWRQPSKMHASRREHTATLLPNGKVLVAGGGDATDNLFPDAEIYDPTGRTGCQWSTTRAMISARRGHAAALLPNGKVLVAGGRGTDGHNLATAELYNPVSDKWETAGAMHSPRMGHVAAVLPGGQVLVAGGTWTATAEVYDPASPASRAWTLVASTNVAHVSTAGAWIDRDSFLLAGGASPLMGSGKTIATAEVYAPAPPGSICTQGFECASGECLGGICCDRACDVGGCASCSLADGAPVDGTCHLLVSCVAFACDTQRTPLACLTTCTTSADCARGFACDERGQCVAPPDTYLDDACALARPGTAGRAFAQITLLLTALAALRRRSRR